MQSDLGVIVGTAAHMSPEVENIGVPADIEVEQDPALVRKGRDPQLEKAVEVALEELKKNPPPVLRRPAFPNYSQTTAH